MNNTRNLVTIFSGAGLFTLLFYHESTSLNLLIFEIIFAAWLMFTRQLQSSSHIMKLFGAATLITGFAVVFTYSAFAFIMNFISLFLFVGALIYPQVKSSVSSFTLSLISAFRSQVDFAKRLSYSRIFGISFGKQIWRLRIFILPAFVIILFAFMYRVSNPVFDSVFHELDRFIGDKLAYIFNNFKIDLIGTYAFGLILCNFLVIRFPDKDTIEQDHNSDESMKRERSGKFRRFSFNGLKSEYSASIFLLFMLNMLLLVLNVIDIKTVWLNFEWQGQYLKQFVHTGTYFLIISILMSIGIVLYFFRGNLNYYSRNRYLKILSYTWLAQNAVLCISVAIRNFWYIHYYSLAYKRIGVVIFLILTLYGLYTVYRKVRFKKSVFYLFRTNSLFIFIVLAFTSLINWDSAIARFNFERAGKGFVHLDFLVTLSDKSLHILDRPMEELSEIERSQAKKFPDDVKYMSPKIYHQKISERKSEFMNEWEKKSILSWNYPEQVTYNRLTNDYSTR